MNTKIPWLAGQSKPQWKAGDGAELEEISKSIANTYNDVPQVEQVITELIHEVPPFTRLAAELEARRQAMCESDNTGSTTARSSSSAIQEGSAH